MLYKQTVLVDVVELNVDGVRRPRDEWRRATPVRGDLTLVKPLSWHSIEKAPVSASLTPRFQLEDLWKARVLYMRGKHLVLTGEQRVKGRYFEQVWWCRFIHPTTPAPVTHLP